MLAQAFSLPEDLKALSFLEDVWVIPDPQEPRAYTIEFVSLLIEIPRFRLVDD